MELNMFNKLVLAAALATPLAVLGLTGTAMAGYSPTSHTPIAREPLRTPEAYDDAGLSCSAARQMLHADGYHHVVTRDCDGRTYSFRATRDGRAVVLRVDSRNGHMSRV
jgi:hypothetical protein